MSESDTRLVKVPLDLYVYLKAEAMNQRCSVEDLVERAIAAILTANNKHWTRGI